MKTLAEEFRPDDIVVAIEEAFDTTWDDVACRRRTASLIPPRKAAAILLYEHTQMSYSEIGAMMGGRDHTTVMHLIRTGKAIDNPHFKSAMGATLTALRAQTNGNNVVHGGPAPGSPQHPDART